MANKSGGTELNELIRSMEPVLEDELYVFAKVALNSDQALDILARTESLNINMMFREKEAWTIILPKSMAVQEQLRFSFECRQITLNVHSSLEAVGFLAAITSELASKLQIGVNPVSGFYHDHLFVPVGSEHKVLETLQKMSAKRQ